MSSPFLTEGVTDVRLLLLVVVIVGCVAGTLNVKVYFQIVTSLLHGLMYTGQKRQWK